ncbi:MAG: site-2 protease family protein [Clostridia bacterium]|nr:site-2 protease family protein [Clostridia bacterium]
MSLILVIILFGLMILVHELGHFLTAKMCGVCVEQLSVGFGPALFKKNYKGTVYALRAIPLGGAVILKGESGEDELLVGKTDSSGEKTKELSYYDVSPFKKILICLSGPFMNFLSAVLILIILFIPVSRVYSTRIDSFIDGFAFEGENGFLKGDRIVSVNGFHIYVYGDLVTALSLGEGSDFDFKLERYGKTVTLRDIPLKRNLTDTDDPGNLKYGFIFKVDSLSFFGKIGYALKNAASFIQSAFKSFELLFTGKAKASDVMGTVGIASEMTKRAKTSSEELWYFVAFISSNLTVINLLPIPGLDGGKIIFSVIEAAARKKLDPKYENYFSYAGLALILILFIFITYNDIARLIS